MAAKETPREAMLGTYRLTSLGCQFMGQEPGCCCHISHLQVACDQVTNQFTNSHKIHVGWYIYLSIHLPVKNQPQKLPSHGILSDQTSTRRNPLQPMLRLDPLQNGAILFHWQPRSEADTTTRGIVAEAKDAFRTDLQQHINILYIYIYLEPVCPLVLGLNPSKEGPPLSIQNKGHLGSRYETITQVWNIYESWVVHSTPPKNEYSNKHGKPQKIDGWYSRCFFLFQVGMFRFHWISVT